MGNAKSFKDLIVWQKAHKLVIEIYKLTKTFPFYNMAQGSLEELKYYLILIEDLGYTIDANLSSKADGVGRLLSRLLSSLP